jgi:hypothetical protein
MKAFRRQPPLEVAVRRYRQGQCPLCGKGKGERRGLEERPHDLYCHSCKRSWSLTYENEEALGAELPLVEMQEPEEEGFVGAPSPPPWIVRIFRKLVSWR